MHDQPLAECMERQKNNERRMDEHTTLIRPVLDMVKAHEVELKHYNELAREQDGRITRHKAKQDEMEKSMYELATQIAPMVEWIKEQKNNNAVKVQMAVSIATNVISAGVIMYLGLRH